MSQTKRNSFAEACLNTLIGFLITLIFSPPIYWMCSVEINYGQIGIATLLFTILSIIRGYVIRRFFNRKPQ